MRLSEYASTRKTRGSYKMPRSVQQSIPIDRIYADGVWQSENVFSLMWQISDINYAMQSDAAKQNILTQLGTVHHHAPLLLRRSPGREAYPGDVFYLHSRLLERSCRMRDDLGGGSITALPIVETQAGDVSAYIPTNVISITDGQIFLETALFNAGNRPAVNVGLSVSRVGGAAQTKAMKKANANLRIELAQYKDMESFSQFSSDLDAETRRQLEHGKALMELLKQPLYQPKSDAEQVVLLTLAAHGVLDEIKTGELRQKTSAFVRQFRTDPSGVMDEIQASGKLSPEQVQTILNAWNAFAGGDAHAIH